MWAIKTEIDFQLPASTSVVVQNCLALQSSVSNFPKTCIVIPRKTIAVRKSLQAMETYLVIIIYLLNKYCILNEQIIRKQYWTKFSDFKSTHLQHILNLLNVLNFNCIWIPGSSTLDFRLKWQNLCKGFLTFLNYRSWTF